MTKTCTFATPQKGLTYSGGSVIHELSVQRENAKTSGALSHTFAYQCKSGF